MFRFAVNQKQRTMFNLLVITGILAVLLDSSILALATLLIGFYLLWRELL